MGHRCQNTENIDVLLSFIDVFNIDITLSMSMCKYRYKVSMSIFFRCFRVLFTPSVCWRAAELDWSIPLEILIFRRKLSERTNQVLPLASKQKVKLQFFFMDHVFHDFALSHYIQEILCLQWFSVFNLCEL